MAIEDLGPAERFAAGAIGRPGERRFFFEVRAAGIKHSLAAEKAQVAALAVQALQLLEQARIEPDDEAVSRLLGEGLDIAEPEPPRFQVGTIAVAVAASELLTVTFESADGEDGVSFVLAPEQLRAMALAALEVVTAGRPLCTWCRLPMDPDGHRCPATNGHHRHE